MNKQKRRDIFQHLAAVNPAPTSELTYQSVFQLLIAVMLSAQATDISVNKATAKLYAVANTPEQIFALGEEKLTTYIKTIGLYHTKARNIINGDIVKVYNERGAVLGGAYVTERLMPGAVYMDHGARYDPIVPGELDRGGAINTITPHNLTSKNATGMVVSSFLVEVEKVDITDLHKQYPEAFKREYDPASGLRFNAWVEGGK